MQILNRIDNYLNEKTEDLFSFTKESPGKEIIKGQLVKFYLKRQGNNVK
jgi:hypothetical protein